MAAGLKPIRFRSDDVAGIAPGLATALAPIAGETPVDTASRYLGTLFGAPNVPAMSLSALDPSAAPDLQPRETRTEPLSDTVQVHFEQKYGALGIYGADVGVEMAADGSLVGIDGQVADIQGLDPIPHLSPDAARSAAAKLGPASHAADVVSAMPRLVVRHDDAKDRWALAWVFSGIVLDAPATDDHPFEQRYTLYLDAHDGHEIVRVPLLRPAHGSGFDGSGREHTFEVRLDAASMYWLDDPVGKLSTFSFNFQSWRTRMSELPGAQVSSPTAEGFRGAAVAAHAHAKKVVEYFAREMRRDGIDGRGGVTVSVVDCVEREGASTQWRNAMWLRADDDAYPSAVRKGVMVYGQIRPAGATTDLSIAEGLEVVAHELTHGVTDYSGGLDYVTESGALNESYSDIFGIFVANDGVPVAEWDWTIGKVLNADRSPIRSMEKPKDHQQPEHMDGFHRLPDGDLPTAWNDSGYVHENSGIHNHAAYHLVHDGGVSPQIASKLFYLTLTTPGRLTPTASFADSRDGLLASAETLLRNGPLAVRKAVQAAIVAAFAKVGL
jgi:Zn-dependent metalloprotease